jgi:hypothetical protein
VQTTVRTLSEVILLIDCIVSIGVESDDAKNGGGIQADAILLSAPQ